MKSRGRMRGFEPVIPGGEVIGDFPKYQDAVSFVNHLVEHDFPAQEISIVGNQLKTVERVRGKLSYARVALTGAVTGSWLGLLIGILFGPALTVSESGEPVLVPGDLMGAVLIGAGIGMLLNVVRFSLNSAKRTFLSTSAVMAESYEVVVPSALSGQARQAAAKPRKVAKKPKDSAGE